MTEEVKDFEEQTEEELEASLTAMSEELEEPDESLEESPDTEPETAAPEEDAPDTDTETADESTEEVVDPVMEAFREQGLDKTYANPAAALTALKEAQAHIGRLSREPADRERQAPQPAPQDQSAQLQALQQRIDEDPQAVILEMAQVLNTQQGTIDGFQRENSLQSAFVEHPEIKANKKAIDTIIQNDNILREANNLDPGWTAEQAYYRWKASNPTPVEKKVEVAKVSDSRKASATTTSRSKSSHKVGKVANYDWGNMTEEEIESAIGMDEDS